MDIFHYTDKSGYDGISSQPDWRFVAHRPKSRDRPRGVYFTDLEPTSSNLRLFYDKLRLPRVKREYMFWFVGEDGLTQLRHGRGRDRFIYFSGSDYIVGRASGRQRACGLTDDIRQDFE